MNEIGLVKSDVKLNIIDYLALNELLSGRIIPKSGAVKLARTKQSGA